MCQDLDNRKYRFTGKRHVRSHENRVITRGTVVKGICEHEKQSFGDLFEPIGKDKTVEEERTMPDLEQFTVDQLKGICKEHGLSGFSSMKKAELVDYVEENVSSREDIEGALKKYEEDSSE